MNADKNPKSIRIYHTHTRSRSHNGINEELSNIFITFYAVKLLTLKLIYCSVHALQLLLLLLLLQFIRLVLLNIMSICARARVCLLILIYIYFQCCKNENFVSMISQYWMVMVVNRCHNIRLICFISFHYVVDYAAATTEMEIMSEKLTRARLWLWFLLKNN